MDRLQRLGAMTELERKLEAVERRLRGIAGAINNAVFALESHLDTDGAAVKQYAEEYFDCQAEGKRLRAKLEELGES